MPLYRSGKKRDGDAAVQKVVIPKGVINPHETTIIEIPARLHKQPIVVAKRKSTSNEIPITNTEHVNGNKLIKEKEHSLHEKTSPTQRSFQPQFHSTCVEGGSDQFSTYPYETVDMDPNFDLDQTEKQERVQLQKDLDAFQKARRKLIEHASKFATQPSNMY